MDAGDYLEILDLTADAGGEFIQKGAPKIRERFENRRKGSADIKSGDMDFGGMYDGGNRMFDFYQNERR